MVLRMACQNLVCLRNHHSRRCRHLLVLYDSAFVAPRIFMGAQILGLSDYPDSLLDFLKPDGDWQLPHP